MSNNAPSQIANLLRLDQTLAPVMSCLVLVFILRYFSLIPGQDQTDYQLKKRENRQSFRLGDHWAGSLPEAAQEILDIFHYPHVYSHFGSRLPRGILLHGIPGTGKTHFARLIANLTNAEFFYASAAQFDEIFVGRGPQRIRALFEAAALATQYSLVERFKAYLSGTKLPEKKAVIFIDELDALGKRSQQHLNPSAHSTISQLLTCMDGLFERPSNIFVIAATNNINSIDEALRRSGRFDRAIVMELPNHTSRHDLLLFYLRGRPGVQQLMDEGVLEFYAAQTNGFSAADIKNMCGEVTMSAIKSTIKKNKNQRTVDDDEEDNNAALDPDTCVIKAANLANAFEAVYQKVSKERNIGPRLHVQQNNNAFNFGIYPRKS